MLDRVHSMFDDLISWTFRVMHVDGWVSPVGNAIKLLTLLDGQTHDRNQEWWMIDLPRSSTGGLQSVDACLLKLIWLPLLANHHRSIDSMQRVIQFESVDQSEWTDNRVPVILVWLIDSSGSSYQLITVTGWVNTDRIGCRATPITRWPCVLRTQFRASRPFTQND